MLRILAQQDEQGMFGVVRLAVLTLTAAPDWTR